MNTLYMSLASVVCCLSLGAVGAIIGALLYDIVCDKRRDTLRVRDELATQQRFNSMRIRYAKIIENEKTS